MISRDAGNDPPPQPIAPLVGPEAPERIGNAFGERLTESLDSTGKALAVVAGLGAFFFGAGYFVEWQRYKHGGLPPEEMLPLIPTAQVAAAGVRELVISVLFMVLTVGMLGFVLVRVASWTRYRTARVAKLLRRALASDVGFPTALIGAFTLLLVPLTVNGMVVATILTGLLFYGLRLIRRFLEAGDDAHFPLWRLALAVGLAAIVLSGTRLAEFPERRPDAVVWLTSGDTVEGDYLASDSNRILLRIGPRECEKACPPMQRGCSRACADPHLLVVRTSEVEKLEVTKRTRMLPYDGSFLDTFVPGLPLTCIPPECRWDGMRRIGLSSYL